MNNIENSRVSEWYRGKTVFITGGTGFMGKVLIEKLLRSCPIRRIYCLVRKKNGQTVEARIEEMLSFLLFEKLRRTNPKIFEKLTGVDGDITEEELGINKEDEKRLVDEVDIVFHVAATINFQEPVRKAVDMNLMGVSRVLELAKKMRKIPSLVHVSTAYSNCQLQETYEELYGNNKLTPRELIALVKNSTDEQLAEMLPSLLGGRPNTYTFTKAMAETLLITEAGNIPFSIIRPSIVCGAWREPEPGWVDNMYAFTGLLVGMGKGALRSLYIKAGIKLDFIPVDVPINLMIVAAYNNVEKIYIPREPFYVCATSNQQPLSIEKLNHCLRETVRNIPQENPIWYPDGSAKTSKTLHNIHVFMVNVIPAQCHDLYRKVMGRKPFAMGLVNKMIKATDALEYFMLRDFTFHNDNTQNLWKALSPDDRFAFGFNVGELNWSQYIDRYQRGVKKFLLNEGVEDEDIERCHRNMRTLVWRNNICQVIMLVIAYFITMNGYTYSAAMAIMEWVSELLA